MATVLLAEDDDQVRVLAESYLEEHGHEVLSAGTAPGVGGNPRQPQSGAE